MTVTAAYANKPGWHRDGNVIDTDGALGMTTEQAIQGADLAWSVEKVPTLAFDRKVGIRSAKDIQERLQADPDATVRLADLVASPDRFNVQRSTDSALLGNVGKTWQPTQPIEGFQLVDDLITEAGGDRAWIETALSLDGGRKIVVMVHLDSGLQIAGEHYASYLAFMNGFDGRTSLACFCEDIRIECTNTLAIGLGQAKASGRIIRVRHTKNAAQRIKTGKQILGIRDARAEELAVQGEWMVGEECDEKLFDSFLDALMPIKAEEGKPAHTMQTGRRDAVKRIYMQAPNLEPIRATRWGALQAVIEYADHGRVFRDEETQIKAQLGMNGQAVKLKDRAADILRRPAKKWKAEFATA
jgi:phage/plasmid-like protein (TIGR03299 family)